MIPMKAITTYCWIFLLSTMTLVAELTPREFFALKRNIDDLVEEGRIAEALSALDKVTGERPRKKIIASIGEDAARESPETVVSWIEKAPGRILELNDDIVGKLCGAGSLRMIKLAQRCPLKKAFPHLHVLPAELRDMPGKSGEIRRSLYMADPDKRCWFESEVVTIAFGSLAKDDVNMALKELEHWTDDIHFDNPRLYQEGLLDIVFVWARKDPAAAYAFAQG